MYVENAKETAILTLIVSVIWYVINVMMVVLNHLVALVPLAVLSIIASIQMSFGMGEVLTALQLFLADDAKEIAMLILNVLVLWYVLSVIVVILDQLAVKVPQSLILITVSNHKKLR